MVSCSLRHDDIDLTALVYWDAAERPQHHGQGDDGVAEVLII